MARPNFFNDNRNRTFPFRQGSVGVNTPSTGPVDMKQLPDDFIVDCGFIMGPESGFTEGVHTVFLHKISRVSNDVVLFEFRSDASDVQETPLTFTRRITDADYTSELLESDIPQYIPTSQSLSLSLSESQGVECGEPYWSGYLVTGSMSSITDRLSVGATITRASETDAIVEPALIQNLNESQVVSVNVANGDRTRALRPQDCPPNEWDFEVGEIYVNRECLQGPIRFRAGYNVAISQRDQTNTINFSAIVNAGLGEPCEEVKLFPEESPPKGSENELLAGDYYCNEVLRSVNGLQGPNLKVIAGDGVSVIADQNTNTVRIDVNLMDLSTCSFSAVSESI